MHTHEESIATTDESAADDTLGGRIVTAREAAGFTTKELAARLGVAMKTVANWENDRAEPRSNKLSMLAGLLGVSPTWLLAGRGTAPRDATENGEGAGLHDEVVRIKAEATRLVERIDSLSMQIAASDQRSAE